MVLRYWLPPALWTAVIFAASSDLFSTGHSAPWLATAINWMLGHPLPAAQFETLHFVLRKGAHLFEYGILSALLLRAFRGDDPVAWNGRWSFAAVALSAGVGSLDEWHQSYLPSRTASPWDVVIDAFGATVAQAIIRAAQVLFFVL